MVKTIKETGIKFMCSILKIRRVINGYAQLTNGHWHKIYKSWKALKDGKVVSKGYLLDERIHRKFPSVISLNCSK